jgi:capsular exopolysaccharide synthesis family protein
MAGVGASMQLTDSLEQQKKVDPRVYLGIIVFRWKLIVVCFLYCLLVGVLYLEFSPRQYDTVSAVAIYRDPSTRIQSQAYRSTQSQTHVGLLQNPGFQARVVEQLASRWLARLGGDSGGLRPSFVVSSQEDGATITMGLRVRNTHPAYARAYLRQVIKDFQAQRELVKQESYGAAARILEDELGRLTEQIRTAEDDAIEFQRVNQMEYVQAKGQLELGYLNMLVSRQEQLNTEKWMLEVQYPRLKGQNVEVMRNALTMTRETGRIGRAASVTDGGSKVADGTAGLTNGPLPAAFPVEKGMKEGDADDGRGWQEVRVRLARLEQQRKELAIYTQPGNPKLRAMDEEIEGLKKELQLHADLEYARIKERTVAIDMQLDALEEAQRRWRNSYLLASKKGSEYRHLMQAVSRLEGMYSELYQRLNELRVDREIKAEHFTVLSPVQTRPIPVWPDPVKILITTLIAGIGSGLALALLAYFFDDKVQSVSDVEAAVGVPFLGGVPFWVHSDLTSRMRPIVSDEHRSGAAEAYRALRTNVLAAVEKSGKKVMLVTSADSKEGKTLTSLNLSLMIAKTGKRVLLLDMDLRRGVLHKSFELERSPGIVEALNEHRPLSSVIRQTPYENLWFASAGSSAEKNTSELLHGTNMESFLGEVLDQYDYVIMDTAPVLRVTDTVILAGCPLACVIYVAHANRTSKPVIRYSLDMLGDVHMIGMIVNSIEMHRISSLYYAYQYPNYAYYSYAYRYGYNYDLYDEHGRQVSYGPFGVARRAVMRWIRNVFTPAE